MPEEHESGKLILVVEDSLVQAAALEHRLTRAGYSVRIAHNGAEGLALAQTLKPALILSDVVMPVMDGYLMCRAIKDTQALKDIPVVMLTQLYEPEEIIRGFESGADAYMTKTVGEDLFMAKVQSLLLNPLQFSNHPDLKCISFEYGAKRYEVHAERAQTLGFLISTYESAIWHNMQHLKAQKQLQTLNEQLEEIVKERTRELTNEIAERKQAEEALKESEQRFRAIFETNTDGMIVVSIEDRKFILCNPAICRMLGYDQDELLGLGIVDIHPNEELPHVIQQFEKQVRGEINVAEDITVKRKDGTVYYADINTSSIILDGKRRILGAFRDVTERRKLMASEVARLAAEKTAKAKAEFLANMSHEIRTPMNAILGFSQIMLRDPNVTPQRQEQLVTINQSGEHLMALLNDVLDMSRIQAERTFMDRDEFDLHALFNEMAAMFRMRSAGKQLSFSMELSNKLPHYVMGDEGKLRMILRNLLGNAVKFTDKGGVILRTDTELRENRRFCLVMEVEDTGPGIFPNDLPMLFQPLDQVTTAL